MEKAHSRLLSKPGPGGTQSFGEHRFLGKPFKGNRRFQTEKWYMKPYINDVENFNVKIQYDPLNEVYNKKIVLVDYVVYSGNTFYNGRCHTITLPYLVFYYLRGKTQ